MTTLESMIGKRQATSFLRVAMLAGIGIVLSAAPSAANTLSSGATGDRAAKAIATQYAATQCLTDDGYGRKRPCSASYKKSNPDWRASDQCYTDDGYGRRRPCSNSYKEKHKAQ